MTTLMRPTVSKEARNKTRRPQVELVRAVLHYPKKPNQLGRIGDHEVTSPQAIKFYNGEAALSWIMRKFKVPCTVTVFEPSR